MNKIEKKKQELEEQNEFLKHMLRSIDDVKKGRVKKLEF